MCIKILQNAWLNRNLFFHSSGGWKSQIWLPAWLSLGRGPFLACRWPPLHCVFTWPFLGVCGERERCFLLLIRLPVHTLTTSFNLNYLLTALSSNAVSFRVRSLPYDFGNEGHISACVCVCVCVCVLYIHQGVPPNFYLF